MEFTRFRALLDADFQRLREIAPTDLAAPVPSCPGWTMETLVRHVAEVYLHKTECMRLGAFPRPWPPDLSGEPAIASLDRAYAELTAEFAARAPATEAATWFTPDQTVGFWIRRMAQETVIHRVDAELAAGAPIAPIPDDLAVDGVDELLRCFLEFGSREWREDFAGSLPEAGHPPILVTSTTAAWLVGIGPDGAAVEPAEVDAPAAATISGEPEPLLLWLWNRDDDGVELAGDVEALSDLKAMLRDATQ